MKVNELRLFDPDQFLVRKTASQEEFEKNFENILPHIFYAVDKAFKQMLDDKNRREPTEITPRYPAESLHGFIYSNLVKNSEVAPFIKKENNTYYLMKGEFKLTFKKVDRNLKPCSNNSLQSILNENNRSASEDDLDSIIYIGFQVDRLWLNLLGVYAIGKDERKKWNINLEKLSQSSLISIVPEDNFIDNNPPILEPEIKLKPRDKSQPDKIG